MTLRWWTALFVVVACGTSDSVAWARRRAVRAQPSSAESQWYAAEPRVPLARVTAGGATGSGGDRIASASHGACAAWAHVGARWTAVDRWGQPVRASRLTDRSYYDATQCFEVGFDADGPPRADPSYDAWAPGRAVLYTRGAYRPAPSMEWSPSAAERAEHARFVAAVEDLAVAPRGDDVHARLQPLGAPPPSLAARTLFFRFTPPRVEGDAHAPRARHFAVSGGRLLVIAERTASGRWVAMRVDNTLSNTRASHALPYLPIAVFDMNADGLPEVVYHDREYSGEYFGDAVLSLEHDDAWREVARSVGGSTA